MRIDTSYQMLSLWNNNPLTVTVQLNDIESLIDTNRTVGKFRVHEHG